MGVYKDKSPTKDGRCWFYKLWYDELDGSHVQKRSKKYATKKELKMQNLNSNLNFIIMRIKVI